MPESAEVRLTVDFLCRYFKNKKITEWVFCGGNFTEIYPNGYEEFDANLPMTISNISCKGKFIYFILENSKGKLFYILHSLMMTGRWQKKYDEYCKWFVETDKKDTIWFSDPRSFATISFTDDINVLNMKLESLGMDILTSDFKLPLFKDLIKKYPLKNICAFLMDQSIISGCGNYIKAESLYDAKVSPLRKIGDLDENEINLLFQALVTIPRIAYNNKGLSIKDYKDENGNKGHHDRNLKIYGKKYAKLTKTADGRMTYWSPSVQK